MNTENFVLKAGTPVSITAAPSYATYDSKNPVSYITGNFYIYDDKVRMNRIRICDSPSKVGMPCMRTGWFNISDLILNEDDINSDEELEDVEENDD